MKLATTLVVSLGLFVVGCDKKKEEGTVQKQDPGVAPKPTEPPPPPPVTPLTGTALADKYKACVEQINGGKWDEFRKDCVDDGYTLHGFAGMPERKGGDGLVEWFKGQKTAFPDWKLTPQLVMVSGRNVVAVNMATGTHQGTMKTPMGDVPATNKKFGMLMLHRLKINDANKATDEWAVADPMTMMGQLGLSPKGSPATRPVMDKGWDGAPIVVVTADDAKEKANLEIVKKLNDAFVANKVPDAMALYTDDATESDQGGEKDIKGKKEIEKGWKMFRGAWSDVKNTNVEMWAAGDYVIQTFKFEGKHTKDMGKLKKTDKNIAMDVAEVIMVKDGKITNLWRFYSGMDFAMQLGLAPPPGAAPPGGAAPGAAPPAGGATPPAADPKKPAADTTKEPEKKM